jgi:hypothetical protein
LPTNTEHPRLFALVSIMYERYLGKDGFFRTSDRLIGEDEAERPAEGGVRHLVRGDHRWPVRPARGIRVLDPGADRPAPPGSAQGAAALARDVAKPDFTSALRDPLSDAESADFRLVTTPRLGLRRVRETPA